jgi:hypothetical protein
MQLHRIGQADLNVNHFVSESRDGLSSSPNPNPNPVDHNAVCSIGKEGEDASVYVSLTLLVSKLSVCV